MHETLGQTWLAPHSRGRIAPTSITMAHASGVPLAEIARDHGITVPQLRIILRQHEIYCFGRASEEE